MEAVKESASGPASGTVVLDPDEMVPVSIPRPPSAHVCSRLAEAREYMVVKDLTVLGCLSLSHTHNKLT